MTTGMEAAWILLAPPESPGYPIGFLLWSCFFVVVIISISIFAGILWYRKTQVFLRETSLHLRHLISSNKHIKQNISGYSVDDEEPFGLLVKETLRQLGDLENEVAKLHQLYGEVHTSLHGFETRAWTIILSNPLRWYRIQQKLVLIRATKSNALSVLKSTEKIANRLPVQGWEVAQQARQIMVEAQKIKTELFNLNRKHMRGKSIENAFEMEKNLHGQLEQIPLYFLSSGKDTFYDHVTKSDIIRVHKIIEDARATMAELHGNAQEWQQTHARTLKRSIESQQIIRELKKSLNNLPPGLDLTTSSTQLSDLETRHKQLLEGISNPETEQLPALTQQGQLLHQEIQQAHRQHRQTLKKYSDFQKLISRVEQKLAKLTQRLDELENATEYPILWSKSRPRMALLNEQFTAIHEPDSGETPQNTRVPELVEQHLITAQEIELQWDELRKKIEGIAGQRTELLSLWSSPAMQQHADWYRNAQSLSTQITIYNPANWSQADIVRSLPNDIQNLEAFNSELMPLSKLTPLDESALAIYLEKSLRYFKEYLSLRTRVKNIQTNWVAIQKKEQSARNELTGLVANINQLDRLLGADPYLQKTAAKDGNLLKAKANELTDALNQRGQGTVSRKASEVHVLVTKTRQMVKRWLSHLQTENMSHENQISTTLEEISKVANLDEPAVIEAGMLLSNLAQERSKQASLSNPGRINERMLVKKTTQPSSPLKSKPVKEPISSQEEMENSSLTDLFNELKRTSHQGQKLAFTLHALKDIVDPILSIYANSRQQREIARVKVAQAAQQIPEDRVWPPSTQTVGKKSERFDQLEAQWNALQASPIHAIWLVSGLSELGGHYQSLANTAQQAVEIAEQEQEKIRALEAEILQAMEDALGKTEQYPNDPVIKSRILQANQKSGESLNALKKDFRQGRLNYDQVFHALYGLLGEMNR